MSKKSPKNNVPFGNQQPWPHSEAGNCLQAARGNGWRVMLCAAPAGMPSSPPRWPSIVNRRAFQLFVASRVPADVQHGPRHLDIGYRPVQPAQGSAVPGAIMPTSVSHRGRRTVAGPRRPSASTALLSAADGALVARWY